MVVQIHDGVRSLPRSEWNALVGDGDPFLDWDWLSALEEGRCVGARTGWVPQPLTARDPSGRLVGVLPLYVKQHSMGEFVFDQSWATAAHRAGISYYPKLLVGVPFTPVDGPRLCAAPGEEQAFTAAAVETLEAACASRGFSSVHVNFCREADAAALERHGWLRRTAWQYHWRNAGFTTFDAYLDSLRSKRRNQVRRELRALDEQGVTVEVVEGDALPDAALMYRLYRSTVDTNPYGQRYLTERFFELLLERCRGRLSVVLARQAGVVIAGTVNVRSADALYGRYWGCFKPLRHLHFNVCYYAGIAHCIRHGLTWFHPGAGGEHKMLRGFDAVPTTSMHYLHDPRLRAAVDEFLGRERVAVEGHIDALQEGTALKRGPGSAESEEL
jgi:uncharacterized protein